MTGWSEWRPSRPYSVGIEEELMLLDPETLDLANRGPEALEALGAGLDLRLSGETHACALELATEPEATVPDVARRLFSAREEVAAALADLGLAVAAAGTHPLAVWSDIDVSPGARFRLVHETMRELARREPTFALHVHIGVEDPERAVLLHRRMRAHLPMLLALSASSPFWQGRDSGLASARTPIFQAFPRTGMPRAFECYADWVTAVDSLLRCGAFRDPTFLWWDVRLQPRLGTVEVRVMDAQPCATDTIALTALVQSVARLELEEGYASAHLLDSPELLDENRFLAARDGIEAAFLHPDRGEAVPAREVLGELLDAAAPHAAALGCARELAGVEAIAAGPPATRQREVAARAGLHAVVADLAAAFAEPVRRAGCAPEAAVASR